MTMPAYANNGSHVDFIPRPFDTLNITPVAGWDTYFVVYVDNKPYAGFVDEHHAREAIELWRTRWPAATSKEIKLRIAGH